MTQPQLENQLEILLVEDEPDIAEVAEEILADQGHQVFHVADATEALRLCKGRSFDAALIDIMLPGVDGLTLADTLRRHWPKMALVATTALDELPDAQDAGLAFVLYKPFSEDQLAAVVLEAVDAKRRRHATEQAPTA